FFVEPNPLSESRSCFIQLRFSNTTLCKSNKNLRAQQESLRLPYIFLRLHGSGNRIDVFSADQSLMNWPTAYTMPKGSSSLTSFELIVLQYAYAFPDRFHLSIGTAFPIAKDLIKTFTLGTKVNYLRYNVLEAAVMMSYTPHYKIAMVGNIVSVGNPRASVHLLLAHAEDF
ncbi:MAG: hypothetical protein WC190_07810, partial [Candidatus Cloacimonadaceae bacterium]